MKYSVQVILILTLLSFFLSADSAPSGFTPSDITTPQEMTALLKGDILSYAKITGKGEAFTGSVRVSFPDGAGRIYDFPSGYSVAAVEKVFFKGNADLAETVFNRLTDFQGLKGMQYYSLSEGKASPLILESRVSGNTTLRQENSGKTAITYFTIKDNRLGTIPFKSRVWSGGGTLSSVNECSGRVSRFGMKVFEPGDYRVYKFIIYDKTAGGWFYCSVQLMRVKSDIMKNLDLLKPENICNRLRGDTVHILGLIGINRRSELAAFR